MSGLRVPGDGNRSQHAAEARPGHPAATRSVREPAARLAVAAEQAAARWPLQRIAAVAVAIMGVFSVAAIIVGGVALADLASARNRVENVLDPAAVASRELGYGLVDQETGVRGYLLSGNPSFLAPYYSGVAIQTQQVSQLRRLTTGLPSARAELAQVQAGATAWRTQYAEPSIAQVSAVGKPVLSKDIATGKALFDNLRMPLGALQADIATARTHAAATLNGSAAALETACITIAVLLLLIVAGVAVGLQVVAIRPLTRIASEAQEVAAGDFGHEVRPIGPREAANLALAVNRMRQRILSELSAVQTANSALRSRAQDLERSNAELEQFAYVASHDLQEPLRKVASFCQLLQRRYVGQLDARADQYIEYAVDGAKRMQVLIDDLLAFSRVGRLDREPALISCASTVSAARTNLTAEIRNSGAVIETADLPVVRAEFSLITSLFQNLLGNAIKFRSQEPPHIVISVQRLEAFWQFAVADNGIGIDPEYADKIFVIFQRLHDRATYSGTGIGLAMCRKIVEYYGGKIWLETTASAGATFCFTLPIPPEGEETG